MLNYIFNYKYKALRIYFVFLEKARIKSKEKLIKCYKNAYIYIYVYIYIYIYIYIIFYICIVHIFLKF